MQEAGVEVGVSQLTQPTIGISLAFACGSKLVRLTGMASGSGLLLSGAFVDEDASALALSFGDVARWWLSMLPTPSPGQVAFATTPRFSEWGLSATSFFLSTSEQSLLGKRYPTGAALTTGLRLFGLSFTLSAHKAIHGTKQASGQKCLHT